MTEKTFRKRCNLAFSLIGAEPLYFNDGDSREDDAFEDDGSLHVRRNGLRACFDVSNGQSLDAAKQNAMTRLVMEALGLAKRDQPLPGRVAVEVPEEKEYGDEDCCPHCGKEY